MKYFVNLDYLRAFFAWSVVISHLLDRLNIIHLQIGNYAVSGFFVLSGFIITYLLLKEYQKNGTIDLFAFYKRRILRIWLLFYIYLLLCLFFLKFKGGEVLYYYILMVPNLAYVNKTMIGFTNHYWSLGVEEQFYIFWPFLILFFRKRFLYLALFIIMLLFSLKVMSYKNDKMFFNLLHITRFDLVALGGIVGFIVHKYGNCIKINVKYIYLFVSVFCVMVICNVFYVHKLINHLIFGIFTAFLILALVIDNEKFKRNSFFELNGKISFGIYIYHSLLLELIINYLFDGFNKSNILVLFAIVICCLISIFSISYVSFFYFEKPFNDLRIKFKKV